MPHRLLVLSIALSAVLLAYIAAQPAAAQSAKTPADDATGCRRAPTKQCVFAIATATALTINSASLINRHLIEVAQAQVAAGDIAGAISNVRVLRADNSTNYQELLIAIAGSRGATEYVPAILAAAARIPNDRQAILALNKIAATFAAAGHVDAAHEAFGSAIAIAKVARPPASRTSASVAIARAATVHDRSAAREAIELALETAKMPITPSACAQIRASIAEFQATMGDYASALSTVTSISDPATRVPPLAHIAKAQAAAGDRAAAKDMVREALAAAAMANGLDRARSLVRIASAQNDIGDRAAATEIIDVVLATAPWIKDLESRASVLLEVVHLQTVMGDLNAALATTEIIEHRTEVTTNARKGSSNNESTQLSITGVTVKVGRRDLAMQNVAEAQARAGNIDGALVAVGKVPEPYWRAKALTELAVRRLKSGDVPGARAIAAAAVSTLDEVEAAVREFLILSG